MRKTKAISAVAAMILMAASSTVVQARIVVPQAIPAQIDASASEFTAPIEIHWKALVSVIPAFIPTTKVALVLPLTIMGPPR